MNQAIDFSTLTWVKNELDETLREARQALESHVENPPRAPYYQSVQRGPLLEVEYESLIADFDSEIRKVLKFLEIDKFIPLTSDFVKVNPDSLEEIIENYNEVKQTLKNTEFEKFLN